MSYGYPKKFIPSSSSSTTHVKTSRLKDNSWIRKDEDEDEDIDRDPNFGKTILGHVSTVTSDSKVPEKTTETKGTSYVQSLTKRFSSSQDELDKISTSPTSRTTTNKWSTLPSSRSSSSGTSTVVESPKTSTTTSTTFSENGKKTETTTTTTSTRSFTDRVFSDGKSPVKGAPYSPLSPSSTKVTETTITSIKGAEDPYLETLTFNSKPGTLKSSTNGNTYSSTTTTRTSSSAEDKLFDSLIPSAKSDPDSSVSTTVTTTSVVKVENPNEDVFPSTTTTKRYSSSEDQLYDTLLPKSITGLSQSNSTTSVTRREVKTVESSLSDKYSSHSPTVTSGEPDFSDKYSSSTSRTYSSSRPDPSDKYSSSTTRSYSSSRQDPSDKYSSTRTYSSSGPDSSYEYTTINSPSVYTTTSTTYKDSRMDNYVDGDSFTKSNIQTLYSAPERAVMEKDLCTYCRKPFNTEAKMVLDDMKINCHASCFKCEVCSNDLGNLKAGDSLWIYRRTVHCDRCFEVTREKWRR